APGPAPHVRRGAAGAHPASRGSAARARGGAGARGGAAHGAGLTRPPTGPEPAACTSLDLAVATAPEAAATAITPHARSARVCARRRSPKPSSAAARRPPISPPTCPPQEMLENVNE